MTIDSIKNGFVIDHIKAGKSMDLYKYLNLSQMDCQVAIIKNAPSKKMGRKDIIKIADDGLKLDLEVLGYVAPDITVNIIKDYELVEKCHPKLPDILKGVIKCRNPRCITSTEQEIQHMFKLVDKDERIYRCVYCESKAKDN